MVASAIMLSSTVGAQQTVPPPAKSARSDTATAARRSSPKARKTTQSQTGSAAKAPASDSLTRFLGKFSYRNLGPAAYTGRISAIAVPSPYRKTVYIGTAGGGVWKTSNAGITWRPISDSLGTQSIGDIAIAPSDTNIIWVGTGEKNSSRSQSWGNGVHKSTNGGRTWQHMGLTETRSVGKIVISPRDPNTVYVAAMGHLWGTNAERGVFKTTNGGTTWTKILFVNDTTGAVDLKMDPSNPDVLYAATWHRVRQGGSHMQGTGAGSGIYKTVNGGTTWTRLTDPALNNGLPTADIGRSSIAISAKNPNLVYAMIAVDRGVTNTSTAPFGGFFKSEDAGAHWVQVNDLAANPHYYYDEIVVEPTNDKHIYMLASPLFSSKDGGKSFNTESLPNVHVDNHALWIDPTDSTHMILGNDGGVYTTFDSGKAWDHAPLPIGQFYTIAIDSTSNPYRICGGLQDNGVWCGPSSSRDVLGIVDNDWFNVNGGDGMWVQVSRTNPNIVYSESQFGNMSRMNLKTGRRDGFKPVALDAGNNSGYEYTWGWTAPITLSQHDTATLYVGANHLFRVHDRGDKGMDWEVVGPDMTRADRNHPEPEGANTSYHALFSIAESPRSRDIIWTGSDDGLVWLTRDHGTTWTNVTKNFPASAPTKCFVTTIAPSHFADGTAYVVYDCHNSDDYTAHIYKTVDFGKSWTSMSNGLPSDGSSHTIFEDPYNPRLLWAGTETGAYVTLDGGAKWRRFGNLPPVDVEKFAMSYRTRELVVGTHGRGAWTIDVGPLEEMTDSLLQEKVHLFKVTPALSFRQTHTYPSFGQGPFVAHNPTYGATISYYLRDALSGPVNMTIMSAKGDTVSKLSGAGYAGFNQVTWDLTSTKPRTRELGDPTTPAELRRVAPGDYIVTLRAGGVTLKQPIRVDERPDNLVVPPR
jgi:photosystem II stability/assembly factor-like uncharacterized protein